MVQQSHGLLESALPINREGDMAFTDPILAAPGVSDITATCFPPF
jgi:hypothetical protein